MADTKKKKLPSGRHKSQIKRQKQNLKRAELNNTFRSKVKTLVKKALVAIEKKDKEQAVLTFKAASRTIQKAVSKGLFHKNTAARKISKLATKIAQF